MDITQPTVFIIGLAFAAIVGLFISLRKYAVEWMRANIGNANNILLEYAADLAIRVVRQTVAHEADNSTKLGMAVLSVKRIINEHGVTFDEQVITDAIESSLRRYKDWYPIDKGKTNEENK